MPSFWCNPPSLHPSFLPRLSPYESTTATISPMPHLRRSARSALVQVSCANGARDAVHVRHQMAAKDGAVQRRGHVHFGGVVVVHFDQAFDQRLGMGGWVVEWTGGNTTLHQVNTYVPMLDRERTESTRANRCFSKVRSNVMQCAHVLLYLDFNWIIHFGSFVIGLSIDLPLVEATVLLTSAAS